MRQNAVLCGNGLNVLTLCTCSVFHKMAGPVTEDRE